MAKTPKLTVKRLEYLGSMLVKYAHRWVPGVNCEPSRRMLGSMSIMMHVTHLYGKSTVQLSTVALIMMLMICLLN